VLQTIHKPKSRASRQILEILQDRIRQGTYSPGEHLPTERELSAEFGADRSAVRAALTRLAVSGLIVRERGRRPWVRQASDRSPLRRRTPETTTRTVAVVVPQHEADQASRLILRGVSDTLRSQAPACRVLIFDTNLRSAPRRVLEQEACAAIEDEGIAGALVWPTLEEGSIASWLRILEQGHPVVFLDRYEHTVPIDYVGVDNYTAAREATEYLLSLGHRQIAHLTNSDPASSVLERIAGYRDALRSAGIPEEEQPPLITPENAGEDWVEEFACSWKSMADRPTAVFVVNDFLAHRLVGLLEEHGIGVPEQVSVIGFDDADRYSPRPALLTTMQQPFERIGQRAAELLLRRLSERPQASRWCERVLFPAVLIERRTCRPLDKPVVAPSQYAGARG
jgi:DNA-binding LacI/PurR family transcriptional regulator